MCKCGQVDDVNHCLEGCDGSQLSPHIGWRNAIGTIDIPQLSNTFDGILCTIGGEAVHWDEFCFINHQDLPIYTDGAASSVGWPFAAAAAAAVQFDHNGDERVARVQVPDDFPVSAASAEFMAVSIAARACNKHAGAADTLNTCNLQLVSDCQDVCEAFRNI